MAKPKDTREFHGSPTSTKFHRGTHGLPKDQSIKDSGHDRWATRGDAIRAGRKPCAVCQP